MVTKSKIPAQGLRTRANYQAALAMEKQGDLGGAFALYEKVVTSEPLNETAWSRLMVILRKQKKIEQELKLINRAVTTYKKATEADQKKWVQANKKKAELTKDLAKALGLLGSNGLPTLNSAILDRWQIRQNLLSQRLKNAKNKVKQKTKVKKKMVQKALEII